MDTMDSSKQVDIWIIDGGVATELEKHPNVRVDFSTSPLWSAMLLLPQYQYVHPYIVDVHLQYLTAGSDIITSGSYQLNYNGLKLQLGDEKDQIELANLFNTSISIAQHARDQFRQVNENSQRKRPLVAASLGSYGASLADGSEFTGQYGMELSVKDLKDWHMERFAQFKLLPPYSECTADLLFFETIPCLREVEAVLDILNDFGAELKQKVLISVSCRSETELNSGESITELTNLLENVRPSAKLMGIGVNCCAPEHVESLLKHFQVPVTSNIVKLAYPNSGEKWNNTLKRWSTAEEGSVRLTPEHWKEYVPKWVDAGARILGGCCRTTPLDIQVISSVCKN